LLPKSNRVDLFKGVVSSIGGLLPKSLRKKTNISSIIPPKKHSPKLTIAKNTIMDMPPANINPPAIIEQGSGGFTGEGGDIDFVDGSDRITGFIDYDENIKNPFSEFNMDNIDSFKFVPFADKKGSTIFSEEKLENLRTDGTANLKSFDGRFEFPFNVHINLLSGKRPEGFGGFYRMQRSSGKIQSVRIDVAGDIDEIDDQLMHELQHIHTAWKSGKLLTTDQTNAKEHDKDKNEQIPMTNDIIGELEHRYRKGESLDSLEKDIIKKIKNADNNFESARNQKAMALFKRYIVDYNVVQNVPQKSNNKYLDQAQHLLDIGRTERVARTFLVLRIQSLIRNKGSLEILKKHQEALRMFDKLSN